jgi:hypothetical protein
MAFSVKDDGIGIERKYLAISSSAENLWFTIAKLPPKKR